MSPINTFYLTPSFLSPSPLSENPPASPVPTHQGTLEIEAFSKSSLSLPKQSQVTYNVASQAHAILPSIVTPASTGKTVTSPITLPIPRTFVYPSGLVLLVVEDPSAKSTSISVSIAAGSHNETEPGSDLAHFVEHLILKRKSTDLRNHWKQFPRNIEIHATDGGTSNTTTLYTSEVSSEHTEEAISLLFHRIMDPELSFPQFESEREVIRHEARQYRGNFSAIRDILMKNLLFPGAPYYKYVFLDPDKLAQVTPDDVKAWIKQHHVPHKLAFSVVGNVNANTVRDQFATLSKNYPAQSLEPIQPQSLTQKPRSLIAEYDPRKYGTEQSYITLAWEIPNLLHSDAPAIELLEGILSKKVHANEATVDAHIFQQHGVFEIAMSTEPDQRKQTKDDILDIIHRIRSGGFTDHELASIKSSYYFDTASSLVTTKDRARSLAHLWAYTRHTNFLNDYLYNIQKVSKQDVISVANRYLKETTVNILELNPTGTPTISSEPEKPVSQPPQRAFFVHSPAPQVTTVNSTDVVEITPQPMPGPPSPNAVKEVRSFHLSNNLPVLLKVNKSTPLVAVQAAFRIPNSKNSDFFAALLLKGTTTRSKQEISNAVKSWGGTLESEFSNGILTISIHTLSPHVNEALDLLSDIIHHATFPEQEVLKERVYLTYLSELRAHVRTEEDKEASLYSEKTFRFPSESKMRDPSQDIFYRALNVMQRYLVQRPDQTEEEEIPDMNSADLSDFRKKFLGARNGIIAVFGDIDADQMRSKVREKFENLPPGRTFLIDRFGKTPQLMAASIASTISVREPSQNEQAVVMFGYEAPATIGDRDASAMQITINALNDRIHKRIREEKGWAYAVHATFTKPPIRALIVYAISTPDLVEDVRKEFTNEVRKLAIEGLTSAEIEVYQEKTLAEHKLSLADSEDMLALASRCTRDELEGRGYDHYLQEHLQISRSIQTVTQEDIQKVAAKYLQAPHVETIIS